MYQHKVTQCIERTRSAVETHLECLSMPPHDRRSFSSSATISDVLNMTVAVQLSAALEQLSNLNEETTTERHEAAVVDLSASDYGVVEK